MSKVLTTFSGRYGDILFSLPTVREIANQQPDKVVDMAIMPNYESLLPLLNGQPYINRAFAIKEWILEGEPFGSQPWKSPNFEGREQYEQVYDLTYQQHPYRVCLMDWIYQGPNVQEKPNWSQEPLPFLKPFGFGTLVIDHYYVAYAFNDMYKEQKENFWKSVYVNFMARTPWIEFLDVSKLSWENAVIALANKSCICYMGCRSANYVLACGTNQKRLVFEPHPMRKALVFACPYGIEIEVTTPDEVVKVIENWLNEKEKI